MKTLNWRHTDWLGKNFIFSIGQEIIGQLTFNSWNMNAVYTDRDTTIKFVKKSFWSQDVFVTSDDKVVGEISFNLFKRQTLKMASGEKYILSTSFWEQEVYWKTEHGETIIKYRQATMSSMGKGLVSLKDTLSIETEKLLICSGLFTRQLIRKRLVLIMVIMIPIFGSLRRL